VWIVGVRCQQTSDALLQTNMCTNDSGVTGLSDGSNALSTGKVFY